LVKTAVAFSQLSKDFKLSKKSWPKAELRLTLLGEESGRLVAHGHTNEHDDCWKALKSQWYLPSGMSLVVLERTIIDPESEHNTRCYIQLIDTGQTTTDGAGCVLGNVKRGQHASGTDTNTSQATTDIEGGTKNINVYLR
jgi:hypothetical protein